ncbi:hypothetical protein VFPPC_13284 [Pochonia chlamydosporia 170]|uniref:Uncharacterized protein n=1 Tax=Pochonia chlamydosporia 170 TaxID=1380566 RepID=A0A179FXX0_METCM|nr:hypothetical protein VFPPC_13284 [Pochonia chlamydosporia 170]OAQ69951.1 hypothetical protein VFPPC_13284 [Pochonia chlamydosporia 170]
MHSPSVILIGALAAHAACTSVTPNGGIVRRYAAPLALMAAPVLGLPAVANVESREPHHQGAKGKGKAKGKAKAKAGNNNAAVAPGDNNKRDLDARHHQGAKANGAGAKAKGKAKGKAKAKAGNNKREIDVRHHQGAKAKGKAKGKAKAGANAAAVGNNANA